MLHSETKRMDLFFRDRILSDPKRDTGAPYATANQFAKLPTGVVYPMMEWFGGGVAFSNGNVKIVKV